MNVNASNRVSHVMAVEDDARIERLEIVAALCRADAVLARDPDAAALELDGLLYRIARVWCQAKAGGLSPSELLQQPVSDAPLVALRLRLALRAPDVRARLVHLWWLVGETFPAQTTTRPSRDHAAPDRTQAAFRHVPPERVDQTPPPREVASPNQ
jgi:hypothetical protein